MATGHCQSSTHSQPICGLRGVRLDKHVLQRPRLHIAIQNPHDIRLLRTTEYGRPGTTAFGIVLFCTIKQRPLSQYFSHQVLNSGTGWQHGINGIIIHVTGPSVL